jgi:membrane associated rhomboid family serine protease
MNAFRLYLYVLSIAVFVAVIWASVFLNINVNDQYVFTLVNGITASTSVIVGFSGTIIGIIFREAKEKQDSKVRMFSFIAIALLMIPLNMLWTTYCFLVMGWTQMAVRNGLGGLIMAFYVFSVVVIFFGEQLSIEIDKK